MTYKGHKKVKSEVAPYLKMTLVVVCTVSFMLLSKSARKKCLAAQLTGLSLATIQIAKL